MRASAETSRDADPVDEACRSLMSTGASLMRPGELATCIGADATSWKRFGAHWEDLVPDSYAAEQGTRRFRRYGHFVFATAAGALGAAAPMPHRAFSQPHDSNPLYVNRDRHFEPLTDAFATDPLLHRILRLLGRLAMALDDIAEWSAKITPFRVIAPGGGEGQPTPEGVHRDGVILVSSLLVGRSNAVGGESSVIDENGNCVLTTTLCEPGTLLVGDDRRTLHGVSPIRPAVPGEPARR
ncbi:MAG: 2OG-Fe dioxygenase family protein, partial [Mycobacteriaceae bacterium]|nr:2OG-Fe dioxygenase family protein [Mycobacteriaceae bacterium]